MTIRDSGFFHDNEYSSTAIYESLRTKLSQQSIQGGTAATRKKGNAFDNRTESQAAEDASVLRVPGC